MIAMNDRLTDQWATRNAVSGIPGGVGEVVVLAFVNDEGGTVAVKQGGRTRAERHVTHQILDGQLSIAGHLDVGQVARVRAVRLQKPVLVAARREVRASGIEGRPITASRVVEMERVNTRRGLPKVEPEEDSMRRLLETRLSDGAALGVNEHYAG